ncbi:MAG: permease [Candidatus Altiarchaeota archaeon]
MLSGICDWLVYEVAGASPQSPLAQTLHFFIYDTVKILVLLAAMIFLVGVGRTYMSPKKIKDILTSKGKALSYVTASIAGAITPFCSCSSIPIFMSFIRAGVPLGPSLSFLVTSPLINEYLAVLMLGFFGLKVTLAYIIVGLSLGSLAGFLLGRIGVERFIQDDFIVDEDEDEDEFTDFRQRLEYGFDEAVFIVKKLWVWVVLGVGVGAVIHGFIPEESIHALLDKTGFFSVPFAVLVGVPIYANCSAVVPIALVLFQKGVPLGTALAFMMATAALSLPEAVILKRVMKASLIGLFFATVAAGIIIIGYVFNVLSIFIV